MSVHDLISPIIGARTTPAPDTGTGVLDPGPGHVDPGPGHVDPGPGLVDPGPGLVAPGASRPQPARPDGDAAGPEHAVDVAAEARVLVAGLLARPGGETSASVYETGRLVSLAPWLTGHHERLAYLVAAQRPGGGWGPHADYILVPTLSATEALLSELGRGPRDPEVAAAAGRGLHALFRWSRKFGATALPDLPAIELIAASLVAAINRHLRRITEAPLDGLRTWVGTPPLPLPRGADDLRLVTVRARLRSGAPLPDKLLHALEVADDAAFQAPGISPTAAGTVGASPAATAAWLGDLGALEPAHPAVRHLRKATEAHGGPVPCAVPITAFERGWVLSWLARAGVTLTVPAELTASLAAGLGPGGVPAGPGLPADADTTSVALYALALLGAPREPDSLLAYRSGTHFCTWPGEQGLSPTVNAHVLDAFGQYTAARPDARPAYGEAMEQVASRLREWQRADGSWSDRWHASPYYATFSCGLALAGFGGPDSAEAVRRAVRWVRATQREDGSWGVWRGTVEETAYAMQVLLLAGEGHDRAAQEVARGYEYLLRSPWPGTRSGPGEPETRPAAGAGTWRASGDHPPMWHDKDLYLPAAIVRAAVLGALHLAQREMPTLRNPDVGARHHA
ncbi:prenyltransferase/squalene oxidase repeat-containing protein [Sphaerisporangium corydalis]|uniref:Prenyltransferase/squalene oxidase repeat-containing protein n=1 Tax=Sphaerisporangium corydalis TaxID=1441875 RepID=A0ABV9E7X6_9ACTN|nr:prenyltransferase/squalene oxidase repeat-containing protein [Sphaerisporangium corydalis]